MTTKGTYFEKKKCEHCSAPLFRKICPECEEPFWTHRGDRTKVKCDKCVHRRFTSSVICVCNVCGRTYKVQKHRFDQGKGKFCSNACCNSVGGRNLADKFKPILATKEQIAISTMNERYQDRDFSGKVFNEKDTFPVCKTCGRSLIMRQDKCGGCGAIQ